MTKHYYHRRDDESISAGPPDEGSNQPLATTDEENNTSTELQIGTKAPTGKARKRTRRTQQSSNGAKTVRRRKPAKIESAQSSGHADSEGIIDLPLRHRKSRGESQPSKAAVDEATLSELQAQGFTQDEAYHLIHVSHRIANSRETREAEAVIRRLRFNRWLFEQGKLSEFSA
jgi:hypothetical protein